MYDHERDTGNASGREVCCAWVVAAALVFSLFVVSIV